MENTEKRLQIAYLVLGILSFALIIYLNIRRTQILEEEEKRKKQTIIIT